jgi:hypothetical protein
MLNVPQHRILYLLSAQKAPEPSRIAGRRVWNEQQVQEIARKLRPAKPTEAHD